MGTQPASNKNIKNTLACLGVVLCLISSSCKKETDRYDVLASLDLKASINYPTSKYHVSQINIVNGYAVQDSFNLMKLGNYSWYSYRDTLPIIIENKNTATCVVASTLQMLILGRKNIDDNSSPRQRGEHRGEG